MVPERSEGGTAFADIWIVHLKSRKHSVLLGYCPFSFAITWICLLGGNQCPASDQLDVQVHTSDVVTILKSHGSRSSTTSAETKASIFLGRVGLVTHISWFWLQPLRLPWSYNIFSGELARPRFSRCPCALYRQLFIVFQVYAMFRAGDLSEIAMSF